MAWDKTYPEDNTLVRVTDDDLRETKSIIQSCFDSEHDFTTGKHRGGSVPCIHIDTDSNVQSSLGTNQIGYATDTAKVYVKSSTDLHEVKRVRTGSGNPFPSGSRLFFYQDHAPIGWSIFTDTSITGDETVMVTTSSGGTTGGTWTVTASGSHRHEVESIESHTHEMYAGRKGFVLYVGSVHYIMSYSYSWKNTADSSGTSTCWRSATGGVISSSLGYLDWAEVSSTTSSGRPPGLYFIVAEKD